MAKCDEGYLCEVCGLEVEGLTDSALYLQFVIGWIHPETLRGWVNQAEIDEGRRPGVTSAEAQRIAELERENRELRRSNEILRTASAYFAAAELDRQRR